MAISVLSRGWNFDKKNLATQLGLEELPGEQELLEYLLEIDIREYGLPVLCDLPGSSKVVPKDIVLQVKRVKNVSVPESSAKSQLIENSGKGVLRYYLTDGHQTISAVSIDGSVKLSKGSKILFHKDCIMESGMLIMNPRSLTVLGGGIPEEFGSKQQGGEVSKIVQDAPKFAVIMKSRENASRQRNTQQHTQFEQVIENPDGPLLSSNNNNGRRENKGRERNSQDQKPSYNKAQHTSSNSRAPKVFNVKGRGDIRFNANDTQPQRMVYEDYEHNISTNLTFTRSSGSQQTQRNSQFSQDQREFFKNNQHSREPRHTPRNTKDNYVPEHAYNQSKGFSNSRNPHRQQNSSRREEHNNRGGQRDGRGRGSQRNQRGNYRQDYGQASYAPAQNQFSVMDEFDFPALGDAVAGMSLQ